MATIRKRGDKYHVQIRKQGHQSLTGSFSSRAEALTWAKTIEPQIERSIYQDHSLAEQITLAEALEGYSNEVLPTHRSMQNSVSYIKTIKNYLGVRSRVIISPEGAILCSEPERFSAR